MDLTRKQVIEILEKADSTVYKEPKTKTAKALEYAIFSLKTDEAYQIMYEGGEVFTKADMVAMLTELQLEIEENTSINSDDSHERNGKRLMRTEIIGMFEQKINKLKENTDGNKND